MESNRNKLIVGAALLVIAEGAAYAIRKTQSKTISTNKKQLELVGKSYEMEELANQPFTTYQQQNPLCGKSKPLIRLFLNKLKTNELMRQYFSEGMLQQDSQYAIGLEKYVMMSMGGPYSDFAVDLKEKHKKLRIPRDTYREWVKLWVQSEKEMGIMGKDIWGELEEQVVY